MLSSYRLQELQSEPSLAGKAEIRSLAHECEKSRDLLLFRGYQLRNLRKHHTSLVDRLIMISSQVRGNTLSHLLSGFLIGMGVTATVLAILGREFLV